MARLKLMISSVVLNHLSLKEIKPTLDSLKFSDEILIIQDKQQPLNFKKLPAKIKLFHRSLSTDFSAQRNFALKKAGGDWVLFVDSDEIVSSQLAEEIKVVVQKDFSGYLISRQDIFYSQPLKHGETGQTKLLRLARKEAGIFTRSVHENWQIRGRVGELNASLSHHKKDLTTGFLERMRLYGPIDGRSLDAENKPFSLFRLLFNPLGKFFLNYIVRRGFLDGLLGIFHAYLMSVQSFTVRVFQKEARLA